MTTTISGITPEAFMAQPADPAEDVVEVVLDPLQSIAESLRLLAAHANGPMVEAETDERDEQVQTLTELVHDIEAEHKVLVDLVEEIEAIIKPSTSKLANTVRAAINAWRAPEVPDQVEAADPHQYEPEDRPGHPAHDAGIGIWRAYGVSEGLPADAVEGMNRSQIRSALGIEQPGTES